MRQVLWRSNSFCDEGGCGRCMCLIMGSGASGSVGGKQPDCRQGGEVVAVGV